MTTPNEWVKEAVIEAGWSLLTPPQNQLLTTISELGAFSVDQIAGMNILSGYLPDTEGGWTRV